MDRSKIFRLRILPERLAVCRLTAGDEIPLDDRGAFYSVTRVGEVRSVVCRESVVPAGTRAEGPWRALEVEGPLDFALTGVLASLAQTLADAGISIFAISTFDTDYILVKAESLPRAVDALRRAGHDVEDNPGARSS